MYRFILNWHGLQMLKCFDRYPFLGHSVFSKNYYFKPISILEVGFLYYNKIFVIHTFGFFQINSDIKIPFSVMFLYINIWIMIKSLNVSIKVEECIRME